MAAEKNSTLVLPFPVELLRFLERSTPTSDAKTPELTEPKVPDDARGIALEKPLTGTA